MGGRRLGEAESLGLFCFLAPHFTRDTDILVHPGKRAGCGRHKARAREQDGPAGDWTLRRRLLGQMLLGTGDSSSAGGDFPNREGSGNGDTDDGGRLQAEV